MNIYKEEPYMNQEAQHYETVVDIVADMIVQYMHSASFEIDAYQKEFPNDDNEAPQFPAA